MSSVDDKDPQERASARLQAENAALRDDTGALRLEISGLRMTIKQRDRRIEQLEGALRLYGEHTVECEREEAGGCICRLDALLAEQEPG